MLTWLFSAVQGMQRQLCCLCYRSCHCSRQLCQCRQLRCLRRAALWQRHEAAALPRSAAGCRTRWRRCLWHWRAEPHRAAPASRPQASKPAWASLVRWSRIRSASPARPLGNCLVSAPRAGHAKSPCDRPPADHANCPPSFWPVVTSPRRRKKRLSRVQLRTHRPRTTPQLPVTAQCKEPQLPLPTPRQQLLDGAPALSGQASPALRRRQLDDRPTATVSSGPPTLATRVAGCPSFAGGCFQNSSARPPRSRPSSQKRLPASEATAPPPAGLPVPLPTRTQLAAHACPAAPARRRARRRSRATLRECHCSWIR